MKGMKAQTILLILFLWTMASCTSSNGAVPTLMPTAQVGATATPFPGLPATNTPISAVGEDDNGEALIEEVDLIVCREALEAQDELATRQASGQDVSELATAVAELMAEVEHCETLLTPTPLNE